MIFSDGQDDGGTVLHYVPRQEYSTGAVRGVNPLAAFTVPTVTAVPATVADVQALVNQIYADLNSATTQIKRNWAH